MSDTGSDEPGETTRLIMSAQLSAQADVNQRFPTVATQNREADGNGDVTVCIYRTCLRLTFL